MNSYHSLSAEIRETVASIMVGDEDAEEKFFAESYPPTGARASRLPFASGARQTTSRRKLAGDVRALLTTSASGVARARGRQGCLRSQEHSFFLNPACATMNLQIWRRTINAPL